MTLRPDLLSYRPAALVPANVEHTSQLWFEARIPSIGGGDETGFALLVFVADVGADDLVPCCLLLSGAQTEAFTVTAMCSRSKSLVYEGLEIWLGGLDSNQDSQIQNLKSCQLDDLPTGLLCYS